MAICKDCPFNSTNAKLKGYKTIRKDEHCTECGCTLAPKTKCLSCSCPLSKWEAEITDEQEKTINDETNI
jgi:hypothetical protein